MFVACHGSAKAHCAELSDKSWTWSQGCLPAGAGDLNSRRGMVAEFIDKPANIKLIKASVPLSEMFQYVSTLRGMSKGRAQYTMQLQKYDVVPSHIQESIVAGAAKANA